MRLRPPSASRSCFATGVLAFALVGACGDSTAPKPDTSAKPTPQATTSTTASTAPPSSASTAPASSASATPSASSAAATPPSSASAAPSAKPTASAKASATPTASASAAAPPPDAGAATAEADAGAPPPAVAGTADAVADSIDAVYVPKKTFTAKFEQTNTQKVSGTVKKSAGTVWVEKPNKISFRYDPPNKNRIVSDGTTIKVYVADDAQMFTQPVAKTEYPGALSFLMGKGLRSSFGFSFHEKSKFEGGPVLLGKPVQPSPHYESVLFYVDKALLAKGDPGAMRRVLILDAQGNRNQFDFKEGSHPPSIDASEFTFTPPEGTNVTAN